MVYDCALKLARIYIKLLIAAASGKSGGDTKGEMLVFTFFNRHVFIILKYMLTNAYITT